MDWLTEAISNFFLSQLQNASLQSMAQIVRDPDEIVDNMG